jgi:hypothetical protein
MNICGRLLVEDPVKSIKPVFKASAISDAFLKKSRLALPNAQRAIRQNEANNTTINNLRSCGNLPKNK